MKIKMNQMLIIAAVVALLSVAYMYMTRSGKNGKGMTIVTPMPQSGYSIENDGMDSAGIPQGLPDTLPPVPEVDAPAPEMLGMETTMAPATMMPSSWDATTPGPVADDVEEFTQYAPRRFKGDIL